MKKKLLLVATGSLSMALAISTIAFATNKNKKDNFAKGGPSPVGFDVDFSSVQASGDDYTLLMRDSKGSTISVTVVGANYDSVNQKFVAKSVDQDFYFYNTDPIRGVSLASFSIFQDKSEKCDMVALTSSHELSLDDVLDGYATEDLSYFYNYFYFSGDYDMGMNVSSMPFLANVRYFLVDLNSNIEGFSLTGMHVESICDDPVAEQPIVERDGTLSSSDQAQLNSIFAGQLQIEKVGHPTWCWSYDGKTMYDSYKSGETSQIITAILDCGFVKTASIAGNEVYQKVVSDTVHSIFVEHIAGQFVDTIGVSYSDNLSYLETSATWPSTYLNSELEPNHASAISPLENAIIKDFTYGGYKENQRKEYIIYANFVDDATEEAKLALLNQFKTLYTNSDWILDEAGSNYATYYYIDNMMLIAAQVSADNLVIFITEAITSVDAPTAAEIAYQINATKYVSDIVSLSGGEGATYLTDFVENPPEDRNSAEVRINNPQSGTFENCKTALEAAGYELTQTYASYYVQYTKVVDSFGSYLRVELVEQSGMVAFQYSFYRSYTEYETLYDAINRTYGVDATDFWNDLNKYVGWEYYGVSNPSTYILVKNANSDLTDQFWFNSGVEYIPAYDGFRIKGSDYVMTYEQVTDGVKLYFTYRTQYEFENYEFYNNLLTEFIENDGLSVEGNAFFFSLGDETYDAFAPYGSDTMYYYGAEVETTRLYNLYKARILADENFVYSEYQDMYINTVTGFAYQLANGRDSKEGLNKFKIHWATGITLYDFDSYTNNHMADLTLLGEFPAIIDSSRYNEKLFCSVTQFGTTSIEMNVKKDSTIPDYVETILADGYILANGVYRKVVGEYVYNIQFIENETSYHLQLSKSEPYQSISAFRSDIAETSALAYVDSVGFAEVFTSTTPSYYLIGTHEEGLNFRTTNLAEVMQYQTYLSEHGFEYSSTYQIYTRANTAGNVYDCVRFTDCGVYYEIEIYKNTLEFVSWNTILTELTTRSYNYDFYKDYIAFPDDQEGNLFQFVNCYMYSVTLSASKSFDLELFDAKVKAHPNYVNSSRMGTQIYYQFKNGYIMIEENLFTYRINIYCSIPVPTEIVDPTVVNLGSIDIDITGELSFFEFTPEEDGMYSFYTTGESDTYGYLYDVDGFEIDHSDDAIDSNFRIDAKLKAGETYYIGVRLYNPGEATVGFNVVKK